MPPEHCVYNTGFALTSQSYFLPHRRSFYFPFFQELNISYILPQTPKLLIVIRLLITVSNTMGFVCSQGSEQGTFSAVTLTGHSGGKAIHFVVHQPLPQLVLAAVLGANQDDGTFPVCWLMVQ